MRRCGGGPLGRGQPFTEARCTLNQHHHHDVGNKWVRVMRAWLMLVSSCVLANPIALADTKGPVRSLIEMRER